MANAEQASAGNRTTGKAKPLLRALAGEAQPILPIWMMRQAGRYLPEYRAVRAEAGSFLDLCYTPDFAVEVTLQPIRRFGFDAAILFSDILVVPHALGQKVTFVEGEGPVLEPITDEAGLGRLTEGGVDQCLAPVYEAVSRLSAELPEQVTLIGFAGAPWTVATYMVGGRGSPDQRAAKLWAYRDPDGFDKLMEIVTETTVRHLKAQVAHGAEVVQIFDTWAGSLSPMAFERWSIAPAARIVRELRADYPELPIIGFPKGAGPLLRTYAAETGVTAVGLDPAMPPEWAVAELPASITLQGNLDPILLMAGGAEMRQQVAAIKQAFSGRPAIFNLGHGILPETPIAHVEEMIRLVRET